MKVTEEGMQKARKWITYYSKVYSFTKSIKLHGILAVRQGEHFCSNDDTHGSGKELEMSTKHKEAGHGRTKEHLYNPPTPRKKVEESTTT